jgi:hypothetical protein
MVSQDWLNALVLWQIRRQKENQRPKLLLTALVAGFVTSQFLPFAIAVVAVSCSCVTVRMVGSRHVRLLVDGVGVGPAWWAPKAAVDGIAATTDWVRTSFEPFLAALLSSSCWRDTKSAE